MDFCVVLLCCLLVVLVFWNDLYEGVLMIGLILFVFVLVVLLVVFGYGLWCIGFIVVVFWLYVEWFCYYVLLFVLFVDGFVNVWL